MASYPISNVSSQPLVSIVTPVFNGEEYLAECIESVLAQTYQNWDYTILNNRSTDRTLEIAQTFAARDSRIRVITNEQFASIIGNHNLALRQVSPQSKYCKVLFADDWLFPHCLQEMLNVAERHPSAGIVGAYGLDGAQVLWQGLPYPSTVVPGIEMARQALLGGPYVLGTPTSLLLRADLVRARKSFYNESNIHADYEACLESFRQSDFGFVHQVLTCSRPRPDSNTTAARDLESYSLGDLAAVITHGPIFLTPEQLADRKEYWMRKYYKSLAKSFLRLRGKDFWKFHRTRLQTLGLEINRNRLAKAVVLELLASLGHPLDALDGVLKWWTPSASRTQNQRAGQ